MAQLRISDLSLGPDGQRRVELTWRDGPVPREAVVDFTDVPETGDGERIRWYLEDYAEYPADPAPVIARAAEERGSAPELSRASSKNEGIALLTLVHHFGVHDVLLSGAVR